MADKYQETVLDITDALENPRGKGDVEALVDESNGDNVIFGRMSTSF